ncbi:hypothetical protein H4J58_08245 [Colwellia sp. MB3u-70]|uniref:hypothetical protein n=1 Tax=unclassified Colwellia TaxID=196834 RepID=UPI0015F36352|nr:MULTISPECIES: hypothetical protein [unclassified Colwellia]MBA6293124.1 hypothetical protein [Colwellia sp. MB3u-8]MBA6307104.1 hypothetical protein [Colwellia sp. MB3u-70]
MLHFISQKATKWALSELKKLPKNQTALLYCLIFKRSKIVDRSSNRAEFENEFHRYFGGYIKGGGVSVFDPFAHEWRASNYLNSTVYGRLLVGGHRWTEGDESYFIREPKGSGWPAKFIFTDDGFNNLLYRTSPPNLKNENRLPLLAIATYYYRFEPLEKAYNSQQELVNKFVSEVLSNDPLLIKLFVDGVAYNSKDYFVENDLTESEKISCYPAYPDMHKETVNTRLYGDDIKKIKTLLKDNQTIADFINALILKELS